MEYKGAPFSPRRDSHNWTQLLHRWIKKPSIFSRPMWWVLEATSQQPRISLEAVSDWTKESSFFHKTLPLYHFKREIKHSHLKPKQNPNNQFPASWKEKKNKRTRSCMEATRAKFTRYQELILKPLIKGLFTVMWLCLSESWWGWGRKDGKGRYEEERRKLRDYK